jgi:tetratricopeptide (TPR) repeat protein
MKVSCTKIIRFFSVLPLLAGVGCATSSLTVDSNPAGAQVSVANGSNNQEVLGPTPIVLTTSNFPELYTAGETLTVSKEGFRPQMIFIPKSHVTANGSLKVNLKAVEVGQANQANEIAEQVAHAQQLLFKKDLTEAERVLRELTEKHSTIAVFHSLLGNVYYLKKDLSKALNSYERALELEPHNLDIEKMVRKIKNTQPEGVVN